ncbi:carotenoid ester lipase precursor [Artomyces pyxidatus]|uniref:Carotenoid ester lipase n=1 Tax=Artomyces pyxidatus TaxID=48021 RepID=A0ACB8SYK3_9AGAM|nr:carotenoid ester lipase precursor [Artomyces pyxidatus]
MFGIVAAALTGLCQVQASLAIPHVSAPTVQLDKAIFTGSSTGNVSRFLGIPYAQPPVGNLRFQRPLMHLPYSGHYNVTAFGPSCIQQTDSVTIPYNISPSALEVIEAVFGSYSTGPDNYDEDCLTINVIVPAGVSAHAKLPVVMWIYGGGFEFGQTADPSTDGGAIVQRSIDIGLPIIYVSANYRVSGFLAGKEVQDAGVGNLGLRDQREALRWLQKYISAFGGDPKKVTIWGQSAGAVSVSLQMVTNGGNNEGLFRAAFMESGSPFPVGPITESQPAYDAFVLNAGCSHANNTLQCLREAPISSIRAAINDSTSVLSFSSVSLAYQWGPSADGDFLKDDPQKLVLQGSVSPVPLVSGDCDDEGTLFSLSNANITTDQEVQDYISKYFVRNMPNASSVEKLLQLYPSDPAQGSPFDTGLQDAITPQYKRLAAIQGDLIFQAPRRFFLQHRSSKQTIYSYLSKRDKTTSVLGSYHGTDMQIIYGGGDLGDYLIRFVATLNPNSNTSLHWPTYSPSSPQLLTLLDGPTPLEITNDTYRAAAFDYVTQLLLEDPL